MQKRLAEIVAELESISTRGDEIAKQAETCEAGTLDEFRSELCALEEKRNSLLAEKSEIESRMKEAEAIKNGEKIAKVCEERKKQMENKIDVASREYRDAFYAMLGGYATQEQRAIFVDNNAPGNGDALMIPKTLDEKIWDGIHTAHPILADITTIRSGIALEVTKHTAIATRTTKKLDKANAPSEESNTFVKVVLYGYDYAKYVDLSYAEAKMSQGALEDYLAEEISAELGEALAKDVFAQILSDATEDQKVTETEDMFQDVKDAMALATLASAPVIYAPASKYYELVGAVNTSGSPFNIGAVLGCQIKLDNAATCVTVVDPKAFVLNEVQSIMIESQRDAKNHKVTVSGYLRAQGTLRKNKAAAYIKEEQVG